MSSIFDWKNPKLFDRENPLCIWLNLFNVTFISMLVIIDLLSSVVVTSQIQGALAVDDTRTTWIGKSFFFASALAPLYTIHAANRYGYKFILFLGNLLFSIGAIGTGFASNYWEMLLFRTLAGMGGGIVMTVSLNVLTITVSDKYRNIALTAYSNLFFGFGIAIGLILGGYIGQTGLWRLLFFMNLYLSLPTLILTWILIPETEPVKTRNYDFFGFFCVALFFFTLLLIVTQAKAPWNTMGWGSPFIIGCYFILFFSFLALLLHSHQNTQALFDLKLFTHVPFCCGALGLIVVGFMVFGVTIELMNQLQRIYLYEYWTLGLFTSMVGIIYLTIGIITTAFSETINPRFFILLGLTLIVISCFLQQVITIESGPMQIGRLLALRSVGIAFVLGPLTVLALSPFSQDDACHAIALITCFRQMGATFGSAIIELVVLMRTPYHALRFGEQVDIYSAPFRNHYRQLNQHIGEMAGQGSFRSAGESKELIIKGIVEQAEIASLNDAIYILGWATIVIALLILGLMIIKLMRPQLHNLRILRR